jgi:beta-hydroxyacyl-ACP dehydratase FabZ
VSVVDDLKLPMDVNAIQKVIPHRYPFLFVDRVVELVKESHICAIRNVSMSDPMLQGHFPGNPIVPGVVIVEGAAQAATILGSVSRGGCSSVLFAEISAARFKRPVVPGDVLQYKVKMVKSKFHFYWFHSEMTVSGEVVAEADFSALMK